MSWRRILLLTTLLLTLLAATSWLVLQRSGATTDLARRLLERVLACEFELAGASIDLPRGAIELRGLKLMDPERKGVALAAIDALTVTVATSPRWEILTVHSILVEGIAVDVDIADGRMPTIDQLLRPGNNDSDGVTEGIPPIAVQRGSARIAVSRDLPVLHFDRVNLNMAPGATADDEIRVGGGIRLANLGLELQLSGSADPGLEHARLAAGATGMIVDASLLARLQPFLGNGLPVAGIGAHLDAFDLWLELADGSVAAGFDSKLSEVECTIPAIPYPVRGAKVHVAGDTHEDGTARFRIERLGELGDLVATGEIRSLFEEPRITVGARGRALRIDNQMVEALGSFPAGANVVGALQPTHGTADLDLFLMHPGADDEVVELDLHVRDADLAYHGFGRERRVGFPLPLTDVEGRVRLRNRDIQLLGIRARVTEAAGGGTIDVAGHVQMVQDADDLVSVDIEAGTIRFTPALRHALAILLADGGAMYDDWEPSGSAAVSVRVRPESQIPGKWQALIRPLGATVQWHRFPLPVQEVRGAILARNDGVRVEVAGRHGNAGVQVAGELGHFQFEDAAHPHLRMSARVEGLPCGPELRRALAVLAPDSASTWSDLAPDGGSLTATVLLGQDRRDLPLQWSLHGDVRGLELRPVILRGMRVLDVVGSVQFEGTGDSVRCRVDSLRARVPLGDAGTSQPVGMSGTIELGAERIVDLEVALRDLRLEEDLASQLDALGIVSLETWRFLAPRGTAHALVRVAGPGGGPSELSVDVELLEASSHAALLPAPFTGIRGRIRADRESLTFEELRGTMADVPVVVDGGSIGPVAGEPSRQQVAFSVRSKSFPVDHRIAGLFQGPLRDALLARSPSGRADIQELALRFLTDRTGAGAPTETVIAGRIDFTDLNFDLGTKFTGFTGSVQIEESRVGGEGGALRGRIRGANFRIFDHPVSGFGGAFRVDDSRLQIDGLGCELHGGKVRGSDPRRPSLTYLFPERNEGRGVLGFELDLASVSLGELLRSSGISSSTYRGTLDGFLRLKSLTDGDFLDVDAQGQLALSDGNLGTVPLFTAIYSQLDEKSRPRFDSGTLAFRVRNRKVQIDQLVVRSPVIAVEGKGTMTLEGYLDVTLALESLFKGSADILLLPPLFQAITKQLVRFHVFGHLADIRVEQRWFAEGKPRRPTLPPVPPRAGRLVRPDF